MDADHKILFKISFSRILEKVLTTLIGRKLFRVSYDDLFGLPIIVTLATFQQLGKYESEKQAFMISKRTTEILLKQALIRAVERPSTPGADLEFNDETASVSSVIVISGGAKAQDVEMNRKLRAFRREHVTHLMG
jgi:hypothetical protein